MVGHPQESLEYMSLQPRYSAGAEASAYCNPQAAGCHPPVVLPEVMRLDVERQALERLDAFGPYGRHAVLLL